MMRGDRVGRFPDSCRRTCRRTGARTAAEAYNMATQRRNAVELRSGDFLETRER